MKITLTHTISLTLCLCCVAMFFGCTPLEKRVDLTYQRSVTAPRGSGEVYVVRPLVEQQLRKVPGSLPVIGTVKEAGTQIIATSDVADWVMRALVQELSSAGYTTKTVSQILPGAGKGVRVRVTRLSVNQTISGLVITTSTDIGLAADVWKNGQLVKTLSVSTGGQDQGLDRSASFVSMSLQRALQSAMQQLIPGIVNTLEG